MKKNTIEITYRIEVKWDEESEAFKTAFESYTEVIDDEAHPEDMVKNAVMQAIKNGANRMIEGVGYIGVKGRIENQELYCGIEIDDDDPLPDVEFVF